MSKSFEQLSISELKTIKKIQKQKLNKEYSEYKKKQKLIADIKEIKESREKIKHTNKPKPKTVNKNKTIPNDTPSYLCKALKRAIKEHEQGIEKEKSALDEFANKYIVKGKPGILPFEYFKSKSRYLKTFYEIIEISKSDLF